MRGASHLVDLIPPKGIPINQYPPIIRTAGQSRIIDLLKGINELTASRAKIKKEVDKKFYASEVFFLSHYGMTPFETMIKTYLYDATKKYKGLKTGSSEIRKLATTIMAQKTPEPPSHLHLEQMIVILSGMVRYEDITVQIAAYRDEVIELGIQSLLRFEAPFPAQMIEVNNSKQLSAPGKVAGANPTSWNAGPVIHDLIKIKWLGNGKWDTLKKKLKTGPYSLTYSDKYSDFMNSEGVLLTPFLTFHYKSILSEVTPIGYWSSIAKYRLAAIEGNNGVSQVHLVEVNPHTGAPFQRGRVVAEVKKSASDALSVVAKHYPHVLELKPNANPTLSKSINVSYQSSKLDESAEIWKRTGNQDGRFFVNVVETNWKWPDTELEKDLKWYRAFSSKVRRKGTRTPQQQLLLNFTSDDPKLRMDSIVTGNPPREIQHLLYGSNDARLMANCFPVSVSKFYLLPSGMEAALERICSTKGANVLLDYTKKKLGGAPVDSGKNTYDYVANLTQSRFEGKLNEMREEMKALGAALTSPYLFTRGYDYVLSGSASERLGTSFSIKTRNAVREIFKAAKWPTAKPTLLFSAPVNDVSDIQSMRSQFERALGSTGGKVPPEISIPEMPEMRLQFAPFIEGGTQKVSWQPIPGLGDPFIKGKTDPSRGFYRYYDEGKTFCDWRTIYTYRDLTFARGVNTRDRVFDSKGVKTFTATHYGEPKKVSELSRATVSNTESAISMSILAAAGFAGLMYAGYLNSKGK